MTDMNPEIKKLNIINQLKNIERATNVKNKNKRKERKESSAEHSWSCLILADYFLSKSKKEINRLRVYELLMYHDLVEIKAGDTPLNPTAKSRDERKTKEEKERIAAEQLRKELPKEISNKFKELFEEFEAEKTIEARYAKAIDAIEPVIHELEYPEDWQGWSEEFLRQKKLPKIREFPEIIGVFEKIIEYMKKNKHLK